MVLGVEDPRQQGSQRERQRGLSRRIKRHKRRNLTGWMHRLAPARLTSRIILINVAGLVILVAGILYFNQTRTGLIAVREESLMTQAQIMAAAVASTAAADTDTFVIDPDLFLEQQLGTKNPAGSGEIGRAHV